MGFTSGFLGGLTLTYSVVYLSLYLHRSNRTYQAILLRQQSQLLKSQSDPLPDPFSDSAYETAPPAYRVEDFGIAEQLKDRWNRELEHGIRRVYETDWEAVRVRWEKRAGHVWKNLRNSEQGREVERKAGEIADGVKEKAGEVREGVKDRVDEVKERVKGGVQQAKDEANRGAENLKDSVKEGLQQAKDGASRGAENMRDSVQEGLQQVKDGANRGRENMRDTLREGMEQITDSANQSAETVKDTVREGLQLGEKEVKETVREKRLLEL